MKERWEMSIRLGVHKKPYLAVALVVTALPCIVAAEAGDAPGESRADVQLTEITVTATRRPEVADKVPISLSSLTQADLADAGIKNIAQLAAVTPGLQFSAPVAPSTITTINIRGINANTGPATVGIYLDDTPLMGRLSSFGNIGGPLPLIADLNRVEVERGPQGTLFGAGSEAGAVRFITNDPNLHDYGGAVEGEFSTTHDGSSSYEYGGSAGGPIAQDTLGFRASAWSRRDGGYVNLVSPLPGPSPDNSVVAPNINRNYEEAFRVAFAYKVGDVLITPAVYYQSVDKDDSGRFYPAYSNTSNGQFNDASFLPEHSIDRWSLPTLKVESPLSFADLTFVSSYLHRDVKVTNDFGDCYVCFGGSGYGSPLGPDVPTSAADAVPTLTGQRDKAYTEELRLASNHPDAFVTWVGGIFYDNRSQEDYQNTPPTVSNPGGFLVDQNYKDTQVAVFAQGDFHLSNQWTATLGYRIAHINTEFNATLAGSSPLSANPTANPTTPRVALSYQVTPDHLLYASASKGFRVGGGNSPLPPGCTGAGFNPAGYEPDWVWSYEIGAKDKLFNNRLEIASSVYHALWSNIQQLVTASPCGISYVGNTGHAAVNGFDLSVRALITPQLRIDAKVAYTNAYFTETTISGGVTTVQEGDKVGYLPQVIAPWNLNVAAEYKIPLPNSDTVRVRVEDQYNSQNPGPFENGIVGGANYVPLDRPDPATNLVNARIGYTMGKLNMSIFANNVFNSHPLIGTLSYFSTSSTYRIQNSTFRPLTLGIGANYEF
jgi:iron complex outermembrane receptor protein